MLNRAFVYWIRNTLHNDIFYQGYVGVSLDVNKRIHTHLNRIKNNKHGNFNLLENIKDGFVIDVVLISDENTCYEIEAKLRPMNNIGWNINAGGIKPPSRLGIKRIEKYGKTWAPMQGKKHSKETKNKMSVSSLGKPKSEEHKLNMSLSRKGKYAPERLLKMSVAKLGKRTGISYTKGKLWWNNGIVNKMSVDKPGESFVKGKLSITKEK